MKKTMRISTLLLALIMAVSLSACGGRTPVDTTQPPAATMPVATIKPVDGTTPSPGTAATGSEDTDTPKYGGVFHYFRNGSPQSLFTILKTQKGGYSTFAVEQLGRKNLATNVTEPLLAESFEEDIPNKTVTVHLHKGVKFHDGSDLTAEVVKWNLEFMIENGNGGMFYNPKSIECPDDYTVVVTFNEEHLDGIAAVGQVQIYSQKAYEDHGLDWCKNNPIGTGPFVFQEYITDRQLTFTRNDNYWQEGLPYLDGVVVEIIPDASASMIAFVNKEIDYIISSNVQMNQQIEAMGYKNVCVPTFGDFSTTGISVNNQIAGNPWENLEVRKAVMIYALNAPELALLGGGPYGIPCAQLFCIKGALIYNEDLENEAVYDLEKAKKMLADAGYADGFETDLYTAPNRIDFATALQEALAKVNIKANIIEVSNSDERRADPTCPGMFITGAATAYDPILRPFTTMLSRYSTAIGKTMTYTDEYMELMDAAGKAKTWEEKAELGRQLAYRATMIDCIYRNVYINGSNVYIQDYLRGSGVENNTLTPECTWLDK